MYSIPVSRIASSKAEPVVCMVVSREWCEGASSLGFHLSRGRRIFGRHLAHAAAYRLCGHDQLRARSTLAAYGFRPAQMNSADIGPRTAPTVTIE